MTHSSRGGLKALSIFLAFALFPHLSTAQKRTLTPQSIEKQIDQMTVEEKVGQLFILGFPQRELTPELKSFLTRTKPGAFVIFKRNFSDLESIRKLNKDLFKLSIEQTKLPPLLAVDQEGGSVTRIPTFPPMPSALSVGQTKSPILAEEMGFEMASMMRDLGFNMNLAPVLDLADPNRFSFIGTRSYGSDPAVVGDMGYAFSKGLIRNAVIPTAKHFPGTGSLAADPHEHAIVNQVSQKDLESTYLPPFATYSKLGLFSAVMISHSIYPHLDPQSQPAVFSKKIVNDILRTDLKFRGLAITDDLQMSASRALLKPEDAALAALKAGNDIVMLTWSFQEQEKAMNRVKKGIESGELPDADLRAKLRRILTAKFYINSNSKRTPSNVEEKNVLLSPKLGKIDDDILEKNSPTAAALTNFRNKRLCVFAASTAFIKSFRSMDAKKSHAFVLNGKTTDADVTDFISEQKCNAGLFVVNGAKTSQLFSKLSKTLRKKMLVLNMCSPSLIKASAGYVMNIYFPHQNAGKKMAQLLNENYASLK